MSWRASVLGRLLADQSLGSGREVGVMGSDEVVSFRP
jgi:hypothetical protein